ncbi:MAG: hypothetical protein B6U97_01085, partial [Candidatus Altiarchaeales archaeon ex4484_96]
MLRHNKKTTLIILFTSLLFIAASNYATSEYAIASSQESYYPSEDIYLIISGPSYMDYIITIIGPFGGIVYSDSGKTDIGGLSYKHLTGFRDSGIYRVVFEVDEVDDVVESCEFIVLDVGLTYTTTSTTQTTSTSTSTTRTTLTSTSTSIL